MWRFEWLVFGTLDYPAVLDQLVNTEKCAYHVVMVLEKSASWGSLQLQAYSTKICYFSQTVASYPYMPL